MVMMSRENESKVSKSLINENARKFYVITTLLLLCSIYQRLCHPPIHLLKPNNVERSRHEIHQVMVLSMQPLS